MVLYKKIAALLTSEDFSINRDNSPRGPVNKIRGLTLPNSFVYLENSGLLRKTYMESSNAVFVFSLHQSSTFSYLSINK